MIRHKRKPRTPRTIVRTVLDDIIEAIDRANDQEARDREAEQTSS